MEGGEDELEEREKEGEIGRGGKDRRKGRRRNWREGKTTQREGRITQGRGGKKEKMERRKSWREGRKVNEGRETRK